MFPPVAFADEDSQEHRIFRQIHSQGLSQEHRMGECAAEPHREHAAEERRGRVQSCAQPLTVRSEIERLQAKGRESGIAAAQARHEKKPPARSDEKSPLRISERREEADDETTGNIHRDRAERKRPAETIGDRARGPETRPAPERATQHDEKVVKQHNSYRGLSASVGVISAGGSPFAGRQTPLPVPNLRDVPNSGQAQSWLRYAAAQF